MRPSTLDHDRPRAEERRVHPQLSEVSLKFRAAYVFAIAATAVLWPFGVPYGVVGVIFGVGLLVLIAILSLPRSVDLMFGMMVSLVIFAAQFLGAVFIGIEIGAAVTPMVLGCVALWFTQLAMFGWDLHRFAAPVVIAQTGGTGHAGGRGGSPDADGDDGRGGGSTDGRTDPGTTSDPSNVPGPGHGHQPQTAS